MISSIKNVGFSSILNTKIEESLSIINKAYLQFDRNLGVFFNGGKDSTVLLDLVNRYHQDQKLTYKMNSFFLKSPNEFPELTSYVKLAEKYWEQNFKVIKSNSLKIGLKMLAEQYNIKAYMLGVRGSDPEGKGIGFFQPTTPGWPKATRVFPLLNWNYDDIWMYLDGLKLPTCELYQKGYTSIGSISKTKPNPYLYDNESHTYKHARELKDGSLERCGRL